MSEFVRPIPGFGSYVLVRGENGGKVFRVYGWGGWRHIQIRNGSVRLTDPSGKRISRSLKRLMQDVWGKTS